MIKEKEQALFEQWKNERNYPTFMSDGLFDEETWNKQDLKILYVLKEADWEDGNRDLCEYLLSEVSSTYWKTWNNIVRWTQAIREGGEYQKTVSKADKTDCLKTIAFLNIKKIGGGATANDEEIRAYGKRDAEYIKRQIELYQPDIIVCCGSGNGKNADILYYNVFPDQVSKWQTPILSYNYFLCSLGSKTMIPVLSFRHPQFKFGGHASFEKAFNRMKEITEKLRERGHLKA